MRFKISVGNRRTRHLVADEIAAPTVGGVGDRHVFLPSRCPSRPPSLFLKDKAACDLQSVPDLVNDRSVRNSVFIERKDEFAHRVVEDV